ncbi:N(4)-(beta-N-acetylglucosaminyl)-L-asparaginase [Dactylosporangium sp. CA-233914]|uniref:N(4)-(beta-N-acetylglucosaminyl)-L-asparaginase n=1 Tax=Dactylosporangium sp. CA-233914 TaxID=3239934 RepID=UPI003D8CA7AE
MKPDPSNTAVVAGSHNAEIGLPAAWEILAAGGSAVDAVEAATRLVEDNPADHSVGYTGYPNLLGEVQLDAAIMDGANRRVGAVGAIAGYRHPVTVARAVMEKLPHTFLVGEGAARFASEIGMTPEDLLTDETCDMWQKGINGVLPGKLEMFRGPLAQLTALAADPEHVAGTVNVVARDVHGHLAAAVSTSGWAWKYPGRIGDSPIVGAGIYADDRYGAAGCTGLGEVSMRGGLVRDVISRLAAGQPLVDAGRAAIEDLLPIALEFPDSAVMNMVAMTPEGEVASFTTASSLEYVYLRDGMSEPVRAKSVSVDWPGVELGR